MVAMHAWSWSMEGFRPAPPERRETLGEVLRRLRGDGLQQDLILALFPNLTDRQFKSMQTKISRYENDGVRKPDELLLDALEKHYGLATGYLSMVFAREKRERELRRQEHEALLGSDIAERQFPMSLLPEDEEREDGRKKA